MYKFILYQWVMRRIDEITVQNFVGRWINQEEANSILSTPQVPLT